MLTHLADILPPALLHRLARLLNMDAVHQMFCPCAPCGELPDPWDDVL